MKQVTVGKEVKKGNYSDLLGKGQGGTGTKINVIRKGLVEADH